MMWTLVLAHFRPKQLVDFSTYNTAQVLFLTGFIISKAHYNDNFCLNFAIKASVMEQCLISETCHFRFIRKKITLLYILQHVQELQYFVVAKQYMHFVDKLLILEGLCHKVNIF
jgi:hypothetical protein